MCRPAGIAASGLRLQRAGLKQGPPAVESGVGRHGHRAATCPLRQTWRAGGFAAFSALTAPHNSGCSCGTLAARALRTKQHCGRLPGRQCRHARGCGRTFRNASLPARIPQLSPLADAARLCAPQFVRGNVRMVALTGFEDNPAVFPCFIPCYPVDFSCCRVHKIRAVSGRFCESASRVHPKHAPQAHKSVSHSPLTARFLAHPSTPTPPARKAGAARNRCRSCSGAR